MKTNRNAIRLTLLCIAICSCGFLRAEVSDRVVNGFGTGNVSEIKSYLSSNVELVIDQSDNLYSKEQTGVILNNFFRSHRPSRCTVVHQGMRDNAQFVISNLETNNGNFRVYFLIKNNLIFQLRIENSND